MSLRDRVWWAAGWAPVWALLLLARVAADLPIRRAQARGFVEADLAQ
jgi:hypothetical protein